MKRTSEVTAELAAITTTFKVEQWSYEECEIVATCDRCSETRPLRTVPETERMECRPCWDIDTLGHGEPT